MLMMAVSKIKHWIVKGKAVVDQKNLKGINWKVEPTNLFKQSTIRVMSND